uniref:Putative secreted protein n=1 Tax=Anopheles marajoara TaxID=58244 RepID=A0A2M4C765_9DIPT
MPRTPPAWFFLLSRLSQTAAQGLGLVCKSLLQNRRPNNKRPKRKRPETVRANRDDVGELSSSCLRISTSNHPNHPDAAAFGMLLGFRFPLFTPYAGVLAASSARYAPQVQHNQTDREKISNIR